MSMMDWYEPAAELHSEPAPAKEKKPRRKAGDKLSTRIIALSLLLLVLIAVSSLAFSGSDYGVKVTLPGSGDRESGSDWQDFVDRYYQSIDIDIVDIDIPRTELPANYKMELISQPEEELSLQELYALCSPSIVAISAYAGSALNYNWGTGVVLSEDGYILTNTHVVNYCSSAKVTLYDDTEYDALLVGADVISDIALLKIDASGLVPAQFGDSSSLVVGQRVAAIGNPLGETFRSTMTDGIISAIDRDVSYQGRSMALLQTNTAINAGNSGGALFNMYGQVIGITNMKMQSSYSSVEGIAFAIPTSTAREVVNSIARYGEVKGRPSIGITIGAIPEDAAEEYNMPVGLYVMEVAEGSDAQAQGIKAGDVITAVNGIPVATTDEVNDIKSAMSVGDSMHFTVWRDGETLEFDVVLMDTNEVYK